MSNKLGHLSTSSGWGEIQLKLHGGIDELFSSIGKEYTGDCRRTIIKSERVHRFCGNPPLIYVSLSLLIMQLVHFWERASASSSRWLMYRGLIWRPLLSAAWLLGSSFAASIHRISGSVAALTYNSDGSWNQFPGTTKRLDEYDTESPGDGCKGQKWGK